MRGVDPKDRFAGQFDKFLSTVVPLLPLSGTDDLLWERLTVVLLAAVIFSELFVRSFSNDMPPLPLSWAGVRLLVKTAMASSMNNSSISRLISVPRSFHPINRLNTLC